MSRTVDDVFSQLITQGVKKEDLFKSVCDQCVEIVLTAHPTQVNRRTLQHKHTRIAKLLQQNDRPDLTPEVRAAGGAVLCCWVSSCALWRVAWYCC